MIRWLALWLVLAGPVAAQGTTSETRPLARADRPSVQVSESAVENSLRPKVRSAALVKSIEAARAARQRGQICGDPEIQGDTLGTISGRGPCGVEDAVRVKFVAGIRLPSNPKMDCRTATALKTWVKNGAIPAVGGEGGGIASLRTIGDYSCRNRNNGSSGRLSEHAYGHAIDIAGIKLQSGREITLLTGWNTKSDGRILRRMWKSACGIFGTVLGPDANRFHRDHFHFDTARYRSGSYCR